MLDPRTVAPSPWRNGLGTTRELATGSGPDGLETWRISVATLDRDARFSSFPEMDRVLVALGALRLTVDGVTTALSTGGQISFAGEADVSADVEAPTSALNVMTRRGVCRADIVLRERGAPPLRRATASVDLADVVADVVIHPDGQESA
jgi:environmental stress-induced protein Ves